MEDRAVPRGARGERVQVRAAAAPTNETVRTCTRRALRRAALARGLAGNARAGSSAPPPLPSPMALFAAHATLHVLRLAPGALSVFDMLVLEEALLRADARNWCILSTGGEPTIVLGVSGDVRALVHCSAARAAGVRAVRRFTGGGTVVTDAGTAFASFIVNKADATRAPLYPRDVMAWSARAYAPVFAAGGALLPRGAPGAPFALREHDYALGDRKFAGNAQAVSRDRWVHHTSFLWRADDARLALLRLPAKRPAWRRDRAHGAFLTQLADAAAPGAGIGALADALVAHLRGEPARGGATVVEATLEDALAVLPRNDRRSNEWVELPEDAGEAAGAGSL